MFAIMSKVAINVIHRFLCRLKSIFLWNTWPGVQSLGYMFRFLRNCQLSSMAIPFYVPRNILLVTQSLLSSPAFGVLTLFYFIHSGEYIVIYHYVLIYTFLIANDVEHLFICLFAILFSEMSLYVLCPFSNWIFFIIEF